jgi:hypothetical protein
VASAILMELNIRLTVLVVETARLERRGVNDTWQHIFLSKMITIVEFYMSKVFSCTVKMQKLVIP